MRVHCQQDATVLCQGSEPSRKLVLCDPSDSLTVRLACVWSCRTVLVTCCQGCDSGAVLEAGLGK